MDWNSSASSGALPGRRRGHRLRQGRDRGRSPIRNHPPQHRFGALRAEEKSGRHFTGPARVWSGNRRHCKRDRTLPSRAFRAPQDVVQIFPHARRLRPDAERGRRGKGSRRRPIWDPPRQFRHRGSRGAYRQCQRRVLFPPPCRRSQQHAASLRPTVAACRTEGPAVRASCDEGRSGQHRARAGGDRSRSCHGANDNRQPEVHRREPRRMDPSGALAGGSRQSPTRETKHQEVGIGASVESCDRPETGECMSAARTSRRGQWRSPPASGNPASRKLIAKRSEKWCRPTPRSYARAEPEMISQHLRLLNSCLRQADKPTPSGMGSGREFDDGSSCRSRYIIHQTRCPRDTGTR